MTPDAPPKLDLGVSLLLIVLAALIYWQAALLPPGMFEPLGAGPVPLAVSAAVMALAAVTGVRAAILWHRGAMPPPPAEGFRPRWRDTLIVMILTVIYVAALSWRVTSYAIATAVFLTLAITIMGRFERRTLPWAVLIAVVLGFGCRYIFTRVFVVDLP